MGLRRLKLSILVAFLLFSQVFARDLEEKPDNKDANVVGVGDAKNPQEHGPYFGHGLGPYYSDHRPYCQYYCGDARCCSAEEFAAFSQVDAHDFNDDKQFFPYPRPYHRPPYPGPYPRPYPRPFPRPYPRPCYRCGYRCCSAEEYAEFVQGGN